MQVHGLPVETASRGPLEEGWGNDQVPSGRAAMLGRS
jgi:hypothetical protein